MAIKLKNSENLEPEVYGNENFGIPKDCTKKQRFSSLKLVFYIVAVVAICITGYKYYTDTVDHFLPKITYDRTKQPLVYNTASGLVFKNENSKGLNMGSTAKSSDLSETIRTASMGKSVFFLSPKDSGTGLDLCYYNMNDENVLILDTDVTDFKINTDGKHIVYRKVNTLYFSDLKSTNIIAENVFDYYLSSNNQFITFFTENGSAMYSCNTAKFSTPELIDEDITEVISPKNDHTKVIYIKNSNLYSKKYGEPEELLAEQVFDAILLGNSVYYTASDTYKRSLDDFFTDEKYEADLTLDMPDGSDFIKEINGLSFFDEEAFLKANKEYKNKLTRDEIREYFKETPPESDGLSLYCYNEGEIALVDTHLLPLHLSYNSCKNTIVYKKYDTQSKDRLDLSTQKSLDEAILTAEGLLNTPSDIDMYLVHEGKNPVFAFETLPPSQIEISLDGKYIYCIESNNDGTKYILNRYEITSTALKNKTHIADGVTDFAVDGSDSTAIIIFNGTNLSFYHEDKLTQLSEKSCHDFFFVDGTLFYYDDYDQSLKSGTLRSIRNGKSTIVDTKVHAFKVRKYNCVSYIKNYNPDLSTGTLYIKNGRAIKRQGNYVNAIIN